MKTKIQNFFNHLKIKNKIIVACLPFILLSYVILFISVSLIMYNQMKQRVLDQTQQNIIEKVNFINAKLTDYDLITSGFLYYTQGVTNYLTKNQEKLTQEQKDDANQFLSKNISSIITDNNPEISNVKLFNEYGDLYINNAIYTNTIEEVKAYADSIRGYARKYHGKVVIFRNPNTPYFVTVARTVYVPTLKESNHEIGFLMLDVAIDSLKKDIQMQQNADSIFLLLTDKDGKVLVNGTNLSDHACEELLSGRKKQKHLVNKVQLAYGDCYVTSIINESRLFHDTHRLFQMEIYIMFLSILIIIGAILYAGNMISGQVQAFIRKLNETSEIDKNAYIEVQSQDEFRELGNVYNKMLSRIDNLIQTVYVNELLTKNAQLETLQAQINPHFLYNTLDCINSLVEFNEKESVQKVVTSLANIMKMSIKGSTFITLEEDISYINQYIFIQKMRFQDRLLFLLEIPEHLYQYYVPKLILQPIVENAIVHGVEEISETGMIGVIASEDEENLYISIKDNGNGIPKEIIQQLQQMDDKAGLSTQHIGIFNIQKKLQILYGKEYGLRITTLKPHGTNVTICIPKSTESGKEPFDEAFNR
ncbi:sensor histidine kinase [Novisyntrophococcus fermenticellae]|uniref:sensor histidine kinase n=1 Tax=Novisyntrophococcus fermenticellae TaxID=2068655 RepID=UPI001E41BCBE|nr:histidine kinase [Novisyntrophococcus fermenticellae]